MVLPTAFPALEPPFPLAEQFWFDLTQEQGTLADGSLISHTEELPFASTFVAPLAAPDEFSSPPPPPPLPPPPPPLAVSFGSVLIVTPDDDEA